MQWPQNSGTYSGIVGETCSPEGHNEQEFRLEYWTRLMFNNTNSSVGIDLKELGESVVEMFEILPRD